MSIDLLFLGLTVSKANPMAHSLSHKMGVGDWGYPRLDRMTRSSAATWALANTPAYSASDTAAHTTGIRVEWQKMGPLRKEGLVVPR